MSSPVVTPELPHWYPNLSDQPHAVQMAHQLMYQAFQEHEQAITALNDKITALTTKVNSAGT